MQTTQRKKDDNTDPTATSRREGRPLHFADTGVPGVPGEQGFTPTWTQGGFRPPISDEGGSVPPQGFGFAAHQGSGYTYAGFPPYQAYQNQSYTGFPSYASPSFQQQGFGRPPMESPNPVAAIAPALASGLSSLTDLVYRGIGMASAQGQAILSAVQTLPAMGGPSAQGRVPPTVLGWPLSRLPPTDIVDEGAELVCQVELPGVKTENVDVSCFARGILVTARSEPEIDIGALMQAERGLQATYRRAINLPVSVQPSGAKATLRDGVLTINLPKANPTEGPRRVPVN